MKLTVRYSHVPRITQIFADRWRKNGAKVLQLGRFFIILKRK